MPDEPVMVVAVASIGEVAHKDCVATDLDPHRPLNDLIETASR